MGVAGVQEAAIAFEKFGHGGSVGFWFGFSFSKIEDVRSDRDWRCTDPYLIILLAPSR